MSEEEWADEEGNLGPVYGSQWRSWPTADGRHIDQISQVIEQLTNSPDSRRIIVSAWNVGELDNMALPPCHAFFQFYVAEGKLSCQLYQRSADIFLGVPFNIASMSLLLMIIAKTVGMVPGVANWVGGHTHLYMDHLPMVEEQLSREPFPLPELKINKELNSIEDIENLTIDDFVLDNYQSHDRIKAELFTGVKK